MFRNISHPTFAHFFSFSYFYILSSNDEIREWIFKFLATNTFLKVLEIGKSKKSKGERISRVLTIEKSIHENCSLFSSRYQFLNILIRYYEKGKFKSVENNPSVHSYCEEEEEYSKKSAWSFKRLVTNISFGGEACCTCLASFL